jgi:carboxypeptidase Q
MSSVISIEELSKLALQSNIYYNLETLCICFPARISGSDTLELALDHLFKYGKDNNLKSREEIVNNVPNWIRGDNEYCSIEIIPNSESLPIPNPLIRRIRIMANGCSIGTNEEGITSEVIIISSWDELELYGNQGFVKDKIVLFDYKHFFDYGIHSQFRNVGADRASKMGAKGVLIRTIAPDETMSGSHTGTQSPVEDGVVPIPAACVAIEDVELMRRLMDRGHILNATIKLPCKRKEDRKSRNLIFEINGCEFPDEIVIVGGHTDSWDCSFLNCQGKYYIFYYYYYYYFLFLLNLMY